MMKNSVCHAYLLVGLANAIAVGEGVSTDPASKPIAGGARMSVAILVFPGVELLDFAGPGEVFSSARDADGNRLFDVFTVGVSKQPTESQRFLTIAAKYDATDAPDANIVALPGGDVNAVMEHAELMGWLEKQFRGGCLMFSVCNGASILAKLGALDGLAVTTHHGNMEILELLEPKANCLRDKRFVDNGNVITAAGVSAGIDGALYLVGRLNGMDTARRVATYMEYDHWSGFSNESLAKPQKEGDRVVSMPGRVHKPERPWAVMRLLGTIRNSGIDAAVQLYPALLREASGHDREMIEPDGLNETAWWLLKHGRDREVGLTILRFIAAAYPESSTAQLRLGLGYLEGGQKDAARTAFERALQLDPKDVTAVQALERCRP